MVFEELATLGPSPVELGSTPRRNWSMKFIIMLYQVEQCPEIIWGPDDLYGTVQP